MKNFQQLFVLAFALLAGCSSTLHQSTAVREPADAADPNVVTHIIDALDATSARNQKETYKRFLNKTIEVKFDVSPALAGARETLEQQGYLKSVKQTITLPDFTGCSFNSFDLGKLILDMYSKAVDAGALEPSTQFGFFGIRYEGQWYYSDVFQEASNGLSAKTTVKNLVTLVERIRPKQKPAHIDFLFMRSRSSMTPIGAVEVAAAEKLYLALTKMGFVIDDSQLGLLTTTSSRFENEIGFVYR